MPANDHVKCDPAEFGADARELAGFAPRNDPEPEAAMLAALRAPHAAAMASFRDAARSDDAAARRESLSQAIRLTRRFALLLDALRRRRAPHGRRGGVAQESAEQPHAREAAVTAPATVRGVHENSVEQPHAKAAASVVLPPRAKT